MKKLENFISIVENAIPLNVCDNIISNFDVCESVFHEQKHDITGKLHRNFNELNICKLSDTYWTNLSSNYYKLVGNALLEYKSIWDYNNKRFPSSYGFEDIRIKKYSKNEGIFDWHVDVGDYESAKRMLVMLTYLNTVEEGGETVISDWDGMQTIIRPMAGSMLIFPALLTHIHKGNIPISSDKYFIGTYVHYM
jgi:hypothetical protein